LLQARDRLWPRKTLHGHVPRPDQLLEVREGLVRSLHHRYGRHLDSQDLDSFLPTTTFAQDNLQPISLRSHCVHRVYDDYLRHDIDLSMLSRSSDMGLESSASTVRDGECKVLQYDSLSKSWINE
jgi:hypothetical protein